MHKLGKYQIKFTYFNAFGKKPTREETPSNCQCAIYEGENILPLSYGDSWCHSNDNFSYTVARKIAFGRALKEFTNDKEKRAYLWEQYFIQFPKDRTKIGK